MSCRHELPELVDTVTRACVVWVVCLLLALHRIAKAVDAQSITGWGVTVTTIWVLSAVWHFVDWRRARADFIEQFDDDEDEKTASP